MHVWIMFVAIVVGAVLNLVRCGSADLGPVFIRTEHGTYVGAKQGQNAPVFSVDSPGNTEIFSIVKFDDGKYALRTSHGTYLRATDDGKIDTYDSLDSLGKFEKIEYDGKVAFITAHKKYLTAEKGAPIRADGTVIDVAQRFELQNA